jgi:hypothetical protein
MDMANPKSWSRPPWHADWKGADQEIEALRAFSDRILNDFPTLRVELEFVEEGYMLVRIFRSIDQLGTLYANIENGKPQYPLYVQIDGNEEEFNVETIEDGICVLRTALN